MTPEQRQQSIEHLKKLGWIVEVYGNKSPIHAPTLRGEIYALEMLKHCDDIKLVHSFDVSYDKIHIPSETISYLIDADMLVKYYDTGIHREVIGITPFGYEMLTTLIWITDPNEQKKYRRAVAFRNGMQKTFSTLDGIMKKTQQLQQQMQSSAPKKTDMQPKQRRHRKPQNWKKYKPRDERPWWDP
jgi:hypothetical protein